MVTPSNQNLESILTEFQPKMYDVPYFRHIRNILKDKQSWKSTPDRLKTPILNQFVWLEK